MSKLGNIEHSTSITERLMNFLCAVNSIFGVRCSAFDVFFFCIGGLL